MGTSVSAAATPRDPYEVLGVARDADRAGGQEGLPPAGARAAPRRQRARPAGRGEVQGGRRGLRDPLRPRAPRHLRPLRTRGPALRRLRPQLRRLRLDRRPVRRLLWRLEPLRRALGRSGGGRRRRGRGRDRPLAGRARRRRSRSPSRRSSAASTVAATAPSRARRSRPASAAAAPGSCRPSTRTPFGQMVRTIACDVCHGDGRVPREPCGECRGRGRTAAASASSTVEVPAGIADGQRIRLEGRDTSARPVRRAGDLYVLVKVTRRRALRARGRRSDHRA